MTGTDAPPALADPAAWRRSRWRAEHLRAGWPQVHIDFVEAEPCARGYRVRAVVDLGDLAPADVWVGLGPAEAAGTEPCATHRDNERMWSSHAYDNGRVLFERVVAPGEDAASEWVVCVHPAHELPGRPVVHRLRVEPPAPGSAHA
jgi:hypothetical protein